MLKIYFTQRRRKKQVTDVSLVLKESDTHSENLSSLSRLSVSDGQKTDSSNVVYNKTYFYRTEPKNILRFELASILILIRSLLANTPLLCNTF